jgi:hypothetical protein
MTQQCKAVAAAQPCWPAGGPARHRCCWLQLGQLHEPRIARTLQPLEAAVRVPMVSVTYVYETEGVRTPD